MKDGRLENGELVFVAIVLVLWLIVLLVMCQNRFVGPLYSTDDPFR